MNRRIMQSSCRQWLPILALYLLVVAFSRADYHGRAPRTANSTLIGDTYLALQYGVVPKWFGGYRPVVRMMADSIIEPFDEARDLPRRPKGKLYKPVGHVRPLSGKLAEPSMFSACFTISSRDKRQPPTCLKTSMISILLMLKNSSRVKKSDFQFDLRELRVRQSAFEPDKRTIVVIPGYLTDREEWQQEIADNWLALEDVNVIQVHWPKGNNRFIYEAAAANVPILARQITILLYYLATLHGRKFTSRQFRSSIHLVGHSLGAHVAGFVGKELEGQVDRITALDPAGPIFDSLPEHERLRRSDAEFVDVLHTNAGEMKYMRAGVAALKKVLSILWAAISQSKEGNNPGEVLKNAYEELKLSQVRRISDSNNTAWFGFEQPLGHMDYYANGGSIQPGCLGDFHVCDHCRATALYIAALKRETAARKFFGEDSSVIREKRHRLFAFRPREYKVFQSGGQVHQECAKFLLSDSYGDADECLATHKRCTVPIDFISSGFDLRRELTEDYQLDLADSSPERRYYFETLDQHPYVSDQMMMRIHMRETPTNSDTWSDRCKLAALVRPPGGEVAFAQVDQRPHNARVIEQDGFYGHIFPVANTNDWTKKFLTPALLQHITSTSESGALLRLRLLPYLPPSVTIKLGYKDAKSGLVKYFEGSKEVEKCMMTIAAVELRSLVSADVSTNLTLWYTTHQGGFTTVESQENLLTNSKKLERPIEVSSLDLPQSFQLSFIGIGDQPST